jgi:cGMP-dependent protein kinase
MHNLGIIYRDLKPENIMVASDGYIKLIDMDTTKQLANNNGCFGRTYTVIGTPHYMAPEILLGKGYNLNADFFSLGVLTYELLTGAMPYGEDTEVLSK